MWQKLFPMNEHPVERIVRVVVGLVGIALVFFGPRTAWGWFGLVPLVTGLVGTCPLFTIFGFSTCKAKAPAA